VITSPDGDGPLARGTRAAHVAGSGKPGQRRAPGPAGLGKQTRQRRAVLRSLARSPGFVTAQALHARLVADGEQIGLSTVYRALHALSRAGLLDTARDPSGGQLFRIRPGRGQGSHQHYLLCRSCRRSVTVTSAAVECWASAIGRRHGFTDVCGTCRR
jgi:Fur family ferric uptake transcriptional regulator